MRYSSKAEAIQAFKADIKELIEEITIIGYQMHPIDILEQMDPIAFEEEFSCWLDVEKHLYAEQ